MGLTMKRILVLLLLAGSGCHSLNRIDPSGPRGAFAGTTAAASILAEATSGAIIGRTFDGEKVSFQDRGFYVGMGALAGGALPFAFAMDVINGPTD